MLCFFIAKHGVNLKCHGRGHTVSAQPWRPYLERPRLTSGCEDLTKHTLSVHVLKGLFSAKACAFKFYTFCACQHNESDVEETAVREVTIKQDTQSQGSVVYRLYSARKETRERAKSLGAHLK